MLTFTITGSHWQSRCLVLLQENTGRWSMSSVAWHWNLEGVVLDSLSSHGFEPYFCRLGRRSSIQLPGLVNMFSSNGSWQVEHGTSEIINTHAEGSINFIGPKAGSTSQVDLLRLPKGGKMEFLNSWDRYPADLL